MFISIMQKTPFTFSTVSFLFFLVGETLPFTIVYGYIINIAIKHIITEEFSRNLLPEPSQDV